MVAPLFSAAEVLEILTDPEIATVATFETTVSSVSDPTTLTASKGTATWHTVYITPQMFKKAYIDGTTVEVGTQITYFSPSGLTFTPENGQKVNIGGTIWYIVNVIEIEGGQNLTCLYEIGIRE